MILGRTLESWYASYPLIRDLVALQETTWFNPGVALIAQAQARGLKVTADVALFFAEGFGSTGFNYKHSAWTGTYVLFGVLMIPALLTTFFMREPPVTLQKANVLIMDEPTNHLDMVCIYGAEEVDESGCTAKTAVGESLKLPGGHHFA